MLLLSYRFVFILQLTSGRISHNERVSDQMFTLKLLIKL